MRFFSIHRELDSIRRQLRAGNRQVRQEQLQQYAVDGTLPEDGLTLAYLRLSEAAVATMEGSVSGGDQATHEQAVRAYEAALAEWQQTLQGGVL